MCSLWRSSAGSIEQNNSLQPNRRRQKSQILASSRSITEQKPFARFPDRASKDKIGINRVYSLCEEFNRFLPLCKDRNEVFGEEQPFTIYHGAAVERIIRDIETIVEETRTKVQHRCYELEYQLDKFVVSIAKHEDDSYLEGNLLDLKFDEMEEFLKQLEVQDEEAFSQYVMRQFQLSMKQSRLYEGNMEWTELVHEKKKFLEKCLNLVQHMINIDQVGNDWLWDDQLDSAHKELDALIRAYHTQEGPDGPLICSWCPSDGKHHHICYVDFSDLVWPHGSESCYYNFALSTRILRSAYLDKTFSGYDACGYQTFNVDDGNVDDDSDSVSDNDSGGFHYRSDSDSATCFHKSSIEILDWLQTRAWSEVRAKVMLTAGSTLPIEIAERIFEYALASEDIPAHPTVKETVIVTPSPVFRKWRVCQKKAQPRPLVRTKNMYLCRAIRRPDSGLAFTNNKGDTEGIIDDQDNGDPEYETVELSGTFMEFDERQQ